jgi:hypothetical protein
VAFSSNDAGDCNSIWFNFDGADMSDKPLDPQIAVVLEVLDHAFDRVSWHGPNLTGAIRGVDMKLAQRRLPGRKCIWEQTLHAAYWKQIVLNKLAGTERFPRPGSNWPKLPAKPTARLWREDVALLHDIHRRLRGAVGRMDPAQFHGKLRKMIYGAAFHDIYHAGQIRLMRKMLTEKRGRS